jgi:hypothetical protein
LTRQRCAHSSQHASDARTASSRPAANWDRCGWSFWKCQPSGRGLANSRLSALIQGCLKLVAAGILPAVSGGFQPLGGAPRGQAWSGPCAFSSGETPDQGRTPTESELEAALALIDDDEMGVAIFKTPTG